jgi:hypothetical protein
MLLALLLLQVVSLDTDPFAFFQPTVTITSLQRSTLQQGYPITQLLPTGGQEDAVFTAVSVGIDGDRLVAWERRIEELKKGKYVLAVGRFSDPPRIEDLAGLELDRDDIDDLRKCRAGHCQLKLSAKEMARLRTAAAHARGDATRAIQEAFRRVIFERVKLYLTSGQVPPYEDQHAPVQPGASFAKLMQATPFLINHAPELSEHLLEYPSKPLTGVESFLYWSRERAVGKAIISVTHVNIVRYHAAGMPEVLIVNRDIYSSHYVNASLSVTALTSRTPSDSNYLVYTNRTEVDILHGIFEGVIRSVMQNRVRDATTRELEVYKQRLESGPPPPESRQTRVMPHSPGITGSRSQ